MAASAEVSLHRCLAVLLLIAASGCASIVSPRKPETRTFAPPTYSSSRALFFWGLLEGQPDLALSEICLGKDADQVTFVTTPVDAIETLVTLGLYSPRTVRVWCQL